MRIRELRLRNAVRWGNPLQSDAGPRNTSLRMPDGHAGPWFPIGPHIQLPPPLDRPCSQWPLYLCVLVQFQMHKNASCLLALLGGHACSSVGDLNVENLSALEDSLTGELGATVSDLYRWVTLERPSRSSHQWSTGHTDACRSRPANDMHGQQKIHSRQDVFR